MLRKPRQVVRALFACFFVFPAAAQAAPDAFTFVQRDNVTTTAFVTSETPTISGADGPWAISLAGGTSAQYSINGAGYTSAAGTLESGQTLRIRHISSDMANTSSTTTVTVGSYSTPFTTHTGASDRTPDAFSFGNVGNVPASTLVQSPVVYVAGFNVPVSVIATGGIEYKIDNGEFTSSNGVLQPGQALVAQHTSAAGNLQYRKTSLQVGGVTGTFTTRTGGNVGPVAVDDRYTVAEATLLSVSAPGVLANDTSESALTAQLVAGPANGQLTLNANGSFTYQPAGGFSGTDSFTYRSRDGTQQSPVGTVSLRVIPNTPPVATPASFSMNEDTVLNGQLTASDADGHALTYAKASDPANGVAVVNSNGSFSYTPTADFFGADSFTFKANDGRVDSAPATVSITVINVPEGALTFNRYEFANKCFAIKSAASGKFIVRTGTGVAATYAATATTAATAEGFYMKPSALGEYLLYNEARELAAAQVAAGNPQGPACAPGPLCSQVLNGQANVVNDAATFVVKVVNDSTIYPPPPPFDIEPSVATLNTYRTFVDPNPRASAFRLASKPDGRRLSAVAAGTLSLAAPAETNAQEFSFEPLEMSACANFPEAHNNATGETFKGTYNGQVLGMADTHVHITSTTFLGGAKAGFPVHKFGVTHAVGDCAYAHGEQGAADGVGAAYVGDPDGHETAGWPTFTDWPSRGSLTHEAIYWKWLERAWLGGLRLVVNDLVDNATLCELQRNANGTAGQECNEMQTARRQIGTTYFMQDYIDAQYGGRGKGWWRVVLSPSEARSVIADGKLAVVIGIEISNLFDCQITYSPVRMQEPFEEDATVLGENTYKCKMTETGAPNEVKTQLDHLKELGVRQFITIHEFDNAFGGNGIFDGMVLNLGNRENSGGNPTPGAPATGPLANDPFAFNPPAAETPSGEFWTTYDCPTEAQLAAAKPFDGYLWGGSGGSAMTVSGGPPPTCQPTGQGGRYGGSTACYPTYPAGSTQLGSQYYTRNQCNARWMTPMGLYTYRKLMEAGMVFDFDHLTLDMKDQALELAEAQVPPYPFVSTHGTFGGTTLEQTRRVLKNGGHLYPSLGNGPSLLADMKEVRDEWKRIGGPITDGTPNASGPFLFGFGFGTDTNGLSGQASPRSGGQITRAGAITYPFSQFNNGWLSNMVPGLDNDGDPGTPYQGVSFATPAEFDVDGSTGKSWHIDADGSAHYGMLAEMVEEVRREIMANAAGNPLTPTLTQPMRDIFNSAEVYIQTWERTLQSQQGILNRGGQATTPGGILRAAPVSTPPSPVNAQLPLLGPVGFGVESETEPATTELQRGQGHRNRGDLRRQGNR